MNSYTQFEHTPVCWVTNSSSCWLGDPGWISLAGIGVGCPIKQSRMREVSGSSGQSLTIREIKSQVQVQKPETEIEARPQNQKIRSEIRRSRTSKRSWFIWEASCGLFFGPKCIQVALFG